MKALRLLPPGAPPPPDKTRDEKIDWCVEDASTGMATMKWYVRQYFKNLNEADLEREFDDAGGNGAL